MNTLTPLPPLDESGACPGDEWATALLAPDIWLNTLLEAAFHKKNTDEFGETYALIAVQHGKIILERYGAGRNADTLCPSWSMAKSITQALVGLLAGDGKIDIHAPADVPEWQPGDDPRSAITLDLLLRMSSGLSFREEYVANASSDVVDMLWGRGKDDVAHFAASFPLAHTPGTFFSYSSGTTNIVSRCASRALHGKGADFESFMRRRLFDPLGIRSAQPKFDAAGTFIGSSFCAATPRDFARFGLLYLRGGCWRGTRLLPAGWVDYARTPTWQQPTEEDSYGAHWWLGLAGPGSFSANGFEGQFMVVVPEKDLVVVRNGRSQNGQKENVKRWVADIVACIA